MATEVSIPNLGYTMTEAKILKWLKSVGDSIEAGENLLEIETDKVSYGIESPVDGIVRAILRDVGDEVPVGGVVALIGTASEEIDMSPYEQNETVAATPETARIEERKRSVLSVSPVVEGGVLVSPAAKKMARVEGIDLSLVKGSGRSGRIRMADVERYLSEARTTRIGVVSSRGSVEVAEIIPMTTMRKTIAQRLSRSSRDAPHISLFIEVDMTEVKRLKDSIVEKIEATLDVRLSLNDIFIKVVAVTLRGHPRLNARLQGDRIEILKDVNIGLAVAVEDGLVVPAIEGADQKRLWQIAKERKDLVERAGQGRLSLVELERGTFTISNLGMYEVVFFTSIINPPQSGILSIGKTVDRPVVRDGTVVIRPIVEMSLSVDHRVVDGAMGAQFLRDLKEALENPYLVF
jgi:pyruvate dehydrogenase E2 component (dihydrolipoamide acetyltransferase)